jgi:hypothetical protein
MASRPSHAFSARAGMPVALFSLTLFTSAALLFVIEPMFAKITLPVLGGTTAVWTTCMLFYQAMLLAGYAFANIWTRGMKSRWQAVLCIGLALVPLAILPFRMPAWGIPPVDRNPVPWLLVIMTIVVGLPFFVLSTIAPTLQKWFSGIGHPLSDDPYFLYAASNLGSMLGLLSYPVFIEPHLSLVEQSRLWAYGYVILVLLIVVCGIAVWRAPSTLDSSESNRRQTRELAAAPSFALRLKWLAFAFVPSSLMLGVTTVLTTEIPPIPMFWVVPLAIYLLSFILVFGRKTLVSKAAVAERMPLLILAAITPVLVKGDWPLYVEIVVNLMVLFVVAVAFHGELASSRPPAEQLTTFYLWIAFGGVLGGLFNAVIAPVIFTTVFEFPLILIFAAFLRHFMLPAAKRQKFIWIDAALPLAIGALVIVLVHVLEKFGFQPGMTLHLLAFGPSLLICLGFARRPLRFALGLAALVAAATFYTGVYQHILHTQRSFYGVYRIANDQTGQYRILFDGQTVHGVQSLAPGRNREPLSYFTRSGPVGQVFGALYDSKKDVRVGIVGLGAGAMACYAKPGDDFTFYEIDPLVVRIASDPRYFTFLRDCLPNPRIALGDARISLKKTAESRFNLLVLDAFGADAIPIHLLTREALQLYLEKLADHGILLFHISNRYLDLQKVLGNSASNAALLALVENDTADIHAGKFPSLWVIMARSKDDLGKLTGDARWIPLKGDPSTRLWTDDYSSVLTVFNWY